MTPTCRSADRASVVAHWLTVGRRVTDSRIWELLFTFAISSMLEGNHVMDWQISLGEYMLVSRLSLSFDSPVALIFTPVTNLVPFR